MSGSLPSSLGLTVIADGSLIVASDHRTNYTAIQTDVNAILTALAVTAKGDLLAATASGALANVAVGANNLILVADSSQSAGVKWGGTFTTYTPTWAASGTAVSLGNGTVTGRYVQIGKLVSCSIAFTAGSTTTFGTGSYTFTLPVTAQGSMGAGTALATDTSASQQFLGIPINVSSTTIQFYAPTAPATVWGQTTPMTWAVGDTLIASFVYEAA